MSDFTHLVRSYLRAHPTDRDPAKGAEIALRIHGNEYRYRAMMRNPQAAAPQIEEELRKYLQRRDAIPTKDEARQIRLEAKAAIEKIKISDRAKAEMSVGPRPAGGISGSPQEFKSGKRFDHDTLPEHIQLIFDQNMSLRRRMSQYHLEIRNLLASTKTCATQDLKALTALLKEADEQYHTNWKKYDSYGKEGQNTASATLNQPTASAPDQQATGS